MLVTIDEAKRYLGIVDTSVSVDVESDLVGPEYNVTITGDGIQTLAELLGGGYTFTSGATVILGYGKTLTLSGGDAITQASFVGSVASATNDDFLVQQVNVISDAIESYCRRKFQQATYIQRYYADEVQDLGDTLNLFHFPVASITSIIYEDVSYTLPVEDYRLRTNGTIKRLDSYWFCEGSNIAVTYVAGEAEIPSPVKQVVYNVLEERWNKKQSGINLNFGNDVQRVSIAGAISVDFDYTLNNNDRKSAFGVILGSNLNVLDYYRSERRIIGTVGEVYVS